jgi:hypothetical protein
MENKQDIAELFEDTLIDLFPTGSRIICNPPVLNTDEDWMILIQPKSFHLALKLLSKHQFYEGGFMFPINNSPKAVSFKSNSNDLNLLVTDNVEYFDSFRNATKLATKLNLTNKKDRITLFQLAMGDKMQ